MKYMLALLFGLVFAVCGISVEAADQAASVSLAIRAALAKAGALVPFEDRDDIKRFYELRAYAPAWQLSDGAAQDTAAVFAALGSATSDGLDPRDYGFPSLPRQSLSGDTMDAAEWDIAVTASLMRYSHDLLEGRLRSLSGNDPRGTGKDLATRLNDAVVNHRLGRFLSSLAPANSDYARLKAALAYYRRIESSGGWRNLPSAQDFKSWPEERRREELMERLNAEDSSAEALGADEALRRFQIRNGLDADGKPGPKTLAVLNVPVQDRIERIIVNLERRRSQAWEMEADRIEVNIAAGVLRVMEAGQQVLISRAIVGSRSHPSPALRAVATAVTVNPVWNVPTSIARREILPKLQRDRHYLQSQNMILIDGPQGDPYGFSVDWSRVSPARFPYRIRQLPGQNNSLGNLKIEMPNGLDVYLHDTPAKNLFSQSDRFFSHGCIRVEEVFRLASYALSGDTEAKIESLRAAVTEGATRHFAMRIQLPVYLLYWTAIPDEGGSAIGFRPDVYDRDVHLLQALGTLRLNRRPSATVSLTAVPDHPS